jgi:hypothetical protein
MTDFFLKRQGVLLPASTQQAHSKQAQKIFYYKQVRRIHPELRDWYNADTLHDQVLHTKAGGVTLSSDQRGFITWVKATEACYSWGEPSSGAECTSSGMSNSSSSSPLGFPFSWGGAAASAVVVGCSVTTVGVGGVSIVPPCNTRKFHHHKILLATWFSFIF